jgi:hypothetical protein
MIGFRWKLIATAPERLVAFSRSLRRSTLVIASVVAVVLVMLLLVQGTRVETGGVHAVSTSGGGTYSWEVWEHGLPWVFLHRTVMDRRSRAMNFLDGDLQWSAWALIGDVVIGLLSAATIAFGWEWRLRHRRFPFQVKLMTLLAGFVVIGGVLAWWKAWEHESWKERSIIGEIEQRGHWCKEKYRGPLWLTRLVNAEELPMQRVATVGLAYDVSQHDVLQLNAYLKQLRYLECLDMDGSSNPDDVLEVIGDLDGIRCLRLNYSTATDRSLNYAVRFPGLVRLEARGTAITGDGLAALARLGSLEVLDVAETAVTDEAFQQLRTLESLRELDLQATKITDATIDHLIDMPPLRVVNLRETNISMAGLARLRESRPGLSILRE